MKLGLFYEGSDWGRSHMAAIKKLASERGYQIALDESYPQGQVDFSSQMLKVRAARPEALLVVAYTTDHILFSRQMFENRIDIPYGGHSVGGGAEDPAFYKALPPKALSYLFVQEDWQIDRLKADTTPELVSANTCFKKELGYEINSYGAQGLSNTYIIRDVLERAASADRDKIRAAFAGTDITYGLCAATTRSMQARRRVGLRAASRKISSSRRPATFRAGDELRVTLPAQLPRPREPLRGARLRCRSP